MCTVNVCPWQEDDHLYSLFFCFRGSDSLVLNPQRKFYSRLKEAIDRDYEDMMWVEDAIFMERNSRTFKARIARIDENAEALCEYLREHPKGKIAHTSLTVVLVVVPSPPFSILLTLTHCLLTFY
jgi:cystathionine gamma-synthase